MSKSSISGSNVSCLEAFLHALKGNEQAFERAVSSEPFDPDEFLAFLKRHTVAGYFYMLMMEAGLLEMLPGDLEGRLRDVHERQSAKAARLLPELHRLRQRYARADLDVIFLKGPFLSQRFYGDPRLRWYGDIDLLVRNREGVVRSDAILREAGYERRSVPLLGHGATMRYAYHFVYRSDRGKIDLHWAFRSHFSYKIDYERVWATSTTERLDGHDFRVVSSEYVLLLLMLSILGDYQKARVRLKFLTDLYKVLQFVGDDIDWEIFFEERKREGVLNISARVLDLTLGVLACRADFPKLASTVSRHCGSPAGATEPIRLLEWSGRVRDKIRNHMWTFRLHEGGMARCIGWRLMAEPFGRAVFR